MQQIRIGRSCGCSYDRIADMNGIVPSLERLAVKLLTRTSDKTFIATDVINRMADAETMAYALVAEFSADADEFLWQAELKMITESGEELFRLPVAGQCGAEVTANEEV